jgi:hypothetical protein
MGEQMKYIHTILVLWEMGIDEDDDPVLCPSVWCTHFDCASRNGKSVWAFELSNEQLDKIAAGSNANASPGGGTFTATSTHNYLNNSGSPGQPISTQSSTPVGTFNGRTQSNQNMGTGRNTH